MARQARAPRTGVDTVNETYDYTDYINKPVTVWLPWGREINGICESAGDGVIHIACISNQGEDGKVFTTIWRVETTEIIAIGSNRT